MQQRVLNLQFALNHYFQREEHFRLEQQTASVYLNLDFLLVRQNSEPSVEDYLSNVGLPFSMYNISCLLCSPLVVRDETPRGEEFANGKLVLLNDSFEPSLLRLKHTDSQCVKRELLDILAIHFYYGIKQHLSLQV